VKRSLFVFPLPLLRLFPLQHSLSLQQSLASTTSHVHKPVSSSVTPVAEAFEAYRRFQHSPSVIDFKAE
jgi:hypothetical protein